MKEKTAQRARTMGIKKKGKKSTEFGARAYPKPLSFLATEEQCKDRRTCKGNRNKAASHSPSSFSQLASHAYPKHVSFVSLFSSFSFLYTQLFSFPEIMYVFQLRVSVRLDPYLHSLLSPSCCKLKTTMKFVKSAAHEIELSQPCAF